MDRCRCRRPRKILNDIGLLGGAFRSEVQGPSARRRHDLQQSFARLFQFQFGPSSRQIDPQAATQHLLIDGMCFDQIRHGIKTNRIFPCRAFVHFLQRDVLGKYGFGFDQINDYFRPIVIPPKETVGHQTAPDTVQFGHGEIHGPKTMVDGGGRSSASRSDGRRIEKRGAGKRSGRSKRSGGRVLLKRQVCLRGVGVLGRMAQQPNSRMAQGRNVGVQQINVMFLHDFVVHQCPKQSGGGLTHRY